MARFARQLFRLREREREFKKKREREINDKIVSMIVIFHLVFGLIVSFCLQKQKKPVKNDRSFGIFNLLSNLKLAFVSIMLRICVCVYVFFFVEAKCGFQENVHFSKNWLQIRALCLLNLSI